MDPGSVLYLAGLVGLGILTTGLLIVFPFLLKVTRSVKLVLPWFLEALGTLLNWLGR